MPLATLAASTPAEIGLLDGARALYYEEQIAMIGTAIARALDGGEQHGE